MEEKNVVHDFNPPASPVLTQKSIIIFIIVLLAGILTGYIVSTKKGPSIASPSPAGSNSSKAVQTGQMVGSNDSSFKDTAEGMLKAGGIDGEGAFHLERPGGDSQNVYMTSSIVDLSQFVGKKVKVWGETQTAQKAGWLMDVGRLQVE